MFYRDFNYLRGPFGLFTRLSRGSAPLARSDSFQIENITQKKIIWLTEFRSSRKIEAAMEYRGIRRDRYVSAGVTDCGNSSRNNSNY